MLTCRQKEAFSYLLDGKDALAIRLTGFAKSLIYQSLVLAKEMKESSIGCSSGRPSCLVILPVRSIIQEQINSHDFDLEVKN